jgi:ABC-type multidrug transport system ATPase subunit
VVEKLCTRIGVIHDGRLVAEGALDDLRRRVGSADASLEDVFLRLVGAERREGSLEWLA